MDVKCKLLCYPGKKKPNHSWWFSQCVHAHTHTNPSCNFSIFNHLHRFNWVTCKTGIKAIRSNVCTLSWVCQMKAFGSYLCLIQHKNYLTIILTPFYFQITIRTIKPFSVFNVNWPVKHWPSRQHPFEGSRQAPALFSSSNSWRATAAHHVTRQQPAAAVCCKNHWIV